MQGCRVHVSCIDLLQVVGLESDVWPRTQGQHVQAHIHLHGRHLVCASPLDIQHGGSCNLRFWLAAQMCSYLARQLSMDRTQGSGGANGLPHHSDQPKQRARLAALAQDAALPSGESAAALRLGSSPACTQGSHLCKAGKHLVLLAL